jgi:hypothetical protein
MSALGTLPSWLEEGAAALAGATSPTLAGALPGLTGARELAPLQRLQRVQEAGLAESSGAGEPIYLAWRAFLRGRGPSVLVIDATGLDVRARGTAAVLDGAPRLLAEGVLVAAGLRDSRTVQLRLPAELNGHEAAFLNAVDGLRSLAHVSTPRMRLDVLRDSGPSPSAEGHAVDGSRLVHTPETWCRIALLFAGASGLDASLLTLRRGVKQRGLVELAHSEQLGAQIDDWGGGVEAAGQDPVLVFDDGLGGFLPLSAADVSCEPLALASAGVVPVPSSLMVMAEGVCLLRQTRRALYRHWQLADNAEGDPAGDGAFRPGQFRRERVASACCRVGLAHVLQPSVDLGPNQVRLAEQTRDLSPDEPVELLSADRLAGAAPLGCAQAAAAALVEHPLGLLALLDTMPGVAALAADQQTAEQARLLRVARSEPDPLLEP